MRRDAEHIPVLRKVLRADIPGKRKRGRPKTRLKDACQRDLKITGLRAGEETEGRYGEENSSVIPATLHDGKSQRKRDNSTVIFSGAQGGRNGVVLILKGKARNSLTGYNAVSDRIIVVMQVYAPTAERPEEEKYALYEQLQTIGLIEYDYTQRSLHCDGISQRQSGRLCISRLQDRTIWARYQKQQWTKVSRAMSG